MNSHDEQAKSTELNKSKGRRRFVRGVGVAVPVALTVQSRSVLAFTCSTVSAHASIRLLTSHNAGQDRNNVANCAGLPPATWVSLANTSYRDKQTLFGTIFLTTDSALSSTKMKNAVSNADEFVKVLAAAYLNLVNGKVVGYYDLDKLKMMWTGRTSGFQPISSSPTVLWYEAQIKEYLIDTWTL